MIDRNWSVYIVQCSDGTYYTGATNNVERRIAKHNSGRGAKYTKNRLPVELVAKLDGLTKSEALKLEYRVKRQPRGEKVAFLLGETR